MLLRQLVFSALKMAAQNPAVRKGAAQAARTAVKAATPALLKASRKAGQKVQSVSNELQEGVRKFKAGTQGEHILDKDEKGHNKGRRIKNITPE